MKFNWIGLTTSILLGYVILVFLMWLGYDGIWCGLSAGFIAAVITDYRLFYNPKDQPPMKPLGKIILYTGFTFLAITLFTSCFGNATEACPKTEVKNFTKEWTAKDAAAERTAQGNCAKYYPSQPCLKQFRKYKDGVYVAICATEESESNVVSH